MWQVLNSLIVGGATVAATLGAARPAPPSSVSSLDAPGHPVVSVAIEVPKSAAPRAPGSPAVSAVGGQTVRAAPLHCGQSTVIVADQVRRSGGGRFSFTVPRSPVYGVYGGAGHLVAFGEFPSPGCVVKRH